MPGSDGEQGGQGARFDAETLQQVMREVRDLTRALEGTATSRLSIKVSGLEIELERAGGVLVAAAPAAGSGDPAAMPAGAPPAAAPGVMPVVAPLVGVFYRASSPGARPFVEVGDTVERGQTVGIVEAMKVMNEVTSDYRGTVVEILVENGEAVQYEQRLMLIDTGA